MQTTGQPVRKVPSAALISKTFSDGKLNAVGGQL
jgi:hypothetical protein